ncbi:MAG: nickel-dependent hydrogenase large subunit, partial [Thermovirgaceae bacterium]|nr:nickel-dependent hydrogenase large subunit [Thermovirgaceae bacterium]
LAEFRKGSEDGMVHQTLFYHYARLIEALYGVERIEELMEDPDITGSDLRVTSTDLYPEGIGVIEAPRGTLIHHYKIDENGALTGVNLIVATGHNNFAMSKGVEMVAKDNIRDGEPTEGILNSMEHVIRCYDPCLSCSTHAVGRMPLHLEIFRADGVISREISN